ncbi:polyphosphoinositide phosphatase [Parasteatoda tepidariorum]|uniref:polyphosphoinositide phosphatase n=1 Tax=Parasteatoda tepidariorum TaxID=114398 RepID=UPI001C71C0F9|nr:polyphosphoinositide phosphatase [Parasteatoda tepidariorum]
MSKESVAYPIVSLVQKIILYKTKARYYLVGCNNTESKFRVLKIDRTESKELNVVDDKVEYSKREIRDLLNMIKCGNRSKQGQKFVSDLKGTISSFGIVGFIRFLEGYYLILITKRKRVAYIGHHTIYKIQATCMVYIPNDGEKNMHPHEAKYVKLFQSMDLSSDFYFSYSYDLTHTLQYNMAVYRELSSFNLSQDVDQSKSVPFWDPQLKTIEGASDEIADNFLESLRDTVENDSSLKSTISSDFQYENSSESENAVWSELRSNEDLSNIPKESGQVTYGVKVKPHWRFVWNSHLLELVDLHPDWLLYITHGFVGQSNLSIFGRSIYLTLIARRSQKFAGTRFLKRGTNDKGDVANEVETEQIVFDSSASSFTLGHFTSFVQMRGSIPSQWSQDISKMVPKPPITLDIADPFCFVAGQHFNSLLQRYGSPTVVLNLVKKREQKKHESILSEEFSGAINYLNQFLPTQHQIMYIGFDMAHINKLKEASVMPRLAQIAYQVLGKIGIFHNRPEFYCQSIHHHSCKGCSLGGFKREDNSRLQTGVVRVNCVDCLDRTNTAQFAFGKAALAFQLYVLGVVENPKLEFDTDSIRMLEELYEDHGDTLALQYGGSQLVHRVKTYRKIAPLSSHSRDILQTLSRYYSNTFSDADKQNAINLFLGVYKPSRAMTPIWELMTDFYLHNSLAAGERICHRNLYTCWWDEKVMDVLPFPIIEDKKELENSLAEIIKTYPADPRTDGFFDHYRPFEMTSITDLLAYTMNHSMRDMMPSFSSDFSPFAVRVRPGRKRESVGETPPNPSVTGISSTASASSSTSGTDTGDDSDSEDNFVHLDSEDSSYSLSSSRGATFENMFTTMKQVYGTELKNPSEKSMKLYKRYAGIGKCAGLCEQQITSDSRSLSISFKLNQKSSFSNDSTRCTALPTVTKESIDIYSTYVNKGINGAPEPSKNSFDIYYSYYLSKHQ